MSDIGTGGGGAPAATTGAPAPAPSAGTAPAPATDGASTGAPPPAAATAAKFKIKVGGAEREVDEPTLMRWAQQGHAAQDMIKQAKAEREAAAMERERVSRIKDAAKDPRALREYLREQGIDEHAYFDALAREREAEARMSPEQRQAAEDRKAAHEARRAREAEEARLHEHRISEQATNIQRAIHADITTLLKAASFTARSPQEAGRIRAEIAGKLALIAEHNVDANGNPRALTKGHVRHAVEMTLEEHKSHREATSKDLMAELEALEDAALEGRISPKLAERIARLAVQKQGARAVAPTVGTPVAPTNGSRDAAGRFTGAPQRYEDVINAGRAAFRGGK